MVSAIFNPVVREQLSSDGKVVIPVGDTSQYLLLIENSSKGVKKITSGRFVPMSGQSGNE